LADPWQEERWRPIGIKRRRVKRTKRNARVLVIEAAEHFTSFHAVALAHDVAVA